MRPSASTRRQDLLFIVRGFGRRTHRRRFYNALGHHRHMGRGRGVAGRRRRRLGVRDGGCSFDGPFHCRLHVRSHLLPPRGEREGRVAIRLCSAAMAPPKRQFRGVCMWPRRLSHGLVAARGLRTLRLGTGCLLVCALQATRTWDPGDSVGWSRGGARRTGPHPAAPGRPAASPIREP